MAAQTAQVSAQPRGELGTRANRRLRSKGLVPGVIYGHKQDVLPVTLPKKELTGHLNHGAHLFNVALDGRNETVLIKEVQYDHLGIEVIHVDFARVSLDERVEVTVPVELKGTPKGEADGGVLQQIISQLEVECLVTEIPEAIRHNVSDLGMDAVLHVRDLQLPPGVRVLLDGDLIVATVKEIQEAAAEPIEAPAEPEVIGRKPTDEEAAAEGEGAEKK